MRTSTVCGRPPISGSGTCGSEASEAAMPTRCCQPPDPRRGGWQAAGRRRCWPLTQPAATTRESPTLAPRCRRAPTGRGPPTDHCHHSRARSLAVLAATAAATAAPSRWGGCCCCAPGQHWQGPAGPPTRLSEDIDAHADRGMQSLHTWVPKKSFTRGGAPRAIELNFAAPGQQQQPAAAAAAA